MFGIAAHGIPSSSRNDVTSSTKLWQPLPVIGFGPIVVVDVPRAKIDRVAKHAWHTSLPARHRPGALIRLKKCLVDPGPWLPRARINRQQHGSRRLAPAVERVERRDGYGQTGHQSNERSAAAYALAARSARAFATFESRLASKGYYSTRGKLHWGLIYLCRLWLTMNGQAESPKHRRFKRWLQSRDDWGRQHWESRLLKPRSNESELIVGDASSSEFRGNGAPAHRRKRRMNNELQENHGNTRLRRATRRPRVLRRVLRCEDMLVADELDAHMAPFILKDGVLHCRRAHFEHFTQPGAAVARYRNFFEMLDTARRHGLNDLLPTNEPMPLLFVTGDGNGCNVAKRQDWFGFPRLTMSDVADKHSNAGCAATTPAEKKSCKWCKTVPIPTFEIWSWIKRANHGDPSGWDKAFDLADAKYPWEGKMRKAVWRGASTADVAQYGGKPLGETPRGRVVQMGMDRPDLIDAAFVKITPQYSGWENTTRLVDERMPFDDQMNYTAIIDVDGNNWSSRFPKLLCLNSVTVKVEPSYIEYFHRDLTPGRHYVPASFDNLTQVVEYVISPENDSEMKLVVEEANGWCRGAMGVETVTRSAMEKIGEYFSDLADVMEDDDSAFDEHVDDLVPCFEQLYQTGTNGNQNSR
ncbi:hypothetical protein THAOC_18482 [Thalassiosira oceanica]|uniref:Glycosyl transferase CAP10 domain-containing protein n=1 Tax=Thalassiosira oceanica TaxID=159749 RepID=K0SJB0_THAOC|nr:hypothetical protein THAOC_18482 [Thalassiosira oceanica]|eukprot:EJK61081.1 hypothetical protein THAOC_18482 [Thalassiosira oceanica]